MKIAARHALALLIGLLGLNGGFAGAQLPVYGGPPPAFSPGPTPAGIPTGQPSYALEPMPANDAYVAPAVVQPSLGAPPTMHFPSGGAACNVSLCCEECGGGSCCPPLWSVDQGVRIITRTRARDNFLTSDADVISNGIAQQTFSPTTGAVVSPRTVFTEKSVTFDIAAGYDVTITRWLGRDSSNRDQFFEFTYWGMNHWDESNSVSGKRVQDSTATDFEWGSLFSAFDSSIGGFNRADMHSLQYASELHNFEWNLRFAPRGRNDRLVLHPDGQWRRECQPGCYVSYLAGVRFVSLDESSHFSSRGVIDDDGALSSIAGDYDVFSQNDMLGVQGGIDVTWRRCRADWGVRAKGAALVNWSQQLSAIGTSDPIFVDLSDVLEASDDEAAFIAEVQFHASYRLRPNLIVSARYDLMWMFGMALAPEQMVFETDPVARVDSDGEIFINGLTLAAEVTW
ncbi:MAG: hypothetical protein ACOY3P_20615 [Planctomycetota bacterium]